MQALAIDHIAALELLTCRHDFSMAGLSNAASDGVTADQISAKIDELWSTILTYDGALSRNGIYTANNAAMVAQARQGIGTARVDVAAGNLDNALEDLAFVESQMDELNVLISDAAKANNAYVYNYPGFVGPNRPSVNVAIGGSVVAPASATSGTWTAPLPDDAAVTVAKSNPQSMLTPAPATVAVNPNSSLAQSIASLLSAGGNAFQNQQIQNILAQAKIGNKPLFVPQSLVSHSTAKTSSAAGDWAIATGIGLAVFGLVAVYAMKRGV